MVAPADLSELKRNAQSMAIYLKLVAHPERLLMLCQMEEREVSVGQIVALSGMSQSAVSQHLARFREEGIVDSRSEAQTRYYRLVDGRMRAIIEALRDVCERERPSA